MDFSQLLLKKTTVPELEKVSIISEQLERYQDLSDTLFKILDCHKDDSTISFSVQQREQFSSSNKQLLEKYRSAFRIISLIRANNADDQFSSSLASYVSEKIITLTKKVISYIPLLLQKLKKKITDEGISLEEDLTSKELTEEQTSLLESLVFFYKMLADYQRYQAEVYFLLIEYLRPYENDKAIITSDSEKDAIKQILKSLNLYEDSVIEKIILDKSTPKASTESSENIDKNSLNLSLFREIISREIKAAEENYEESLKIGKDSLKITNHVLLGAILNYTVFLFEIEKKESEAINIALDYYQKAMENLAAVNDEDEYSKANLILILLKDNIDGWKGDKVLNERKSTKF